MSRFKYTLIRTAFEGLALSGLTGLIRRMSPTRGVIFTLHRVLPQPPAEFSPNAILQITPEFLEAVILKAHALGFDLVSMDEAIARLEGKKPERQFAVLTFDDGYRDNLKHALPILRRHQCPFTLYVPTAFIDGKGQIWWQAIEDIISRAATVEDCNGRFVPSADLAEKNSAYNTIYWQMRDMPEPARVAYIKKLAKAHNYNLEKQCRDLIMNWDELQTFVDEPLCTIGAHTVNHYELAKLPAEEARAEMHKSALELQKRTGTRPEHLSYPIGAPRAAAQREYQTADELGFATAVTTIPGGVSKKHARNLTALPRISLNGYYQNPRFLDVFFTGAIFSLIGRRLG